MPDREKVIKAYEDFVNGYICFSKSDDYEYEMHKAVLALLKEQPEIVRCKDCKHYDEQCQQCERIDGIMLPDFFCADGERKSD